LLSKLNDGNEEYDGPQELLDDDPDEKEIPFEL
jgi:hypothetical protein